MSSLDTTHLHIYEPSPSALFTLSLHDALPISLWHTGIVHLEGIMQDRIRILLNTVGGAKPLLEFTSRSKIAGDRKSTRLNSSHTVISYAVFCLKKKKTISHR